MQISSNIESQFLLFITQVAGQWIRKIKTKTEIESEMEMEMEMERSWTAKSLVWLLTSQVNFPLVDCCDFKRI